MPDADQRPCLTCGALKPPSDFYRHRRSKTGLTASCKPCTRSMAEAATERREALTALCAETVARLAARGATAPTEIPDLDLEDPFA